MTGLGVSWRKDQRGVLRNLPSLEMFSPITTTDVKTTMVTLSFNCNKNGFGAHGVDEISLCSSKAGAGDMKDATVMLAAIEGGDDGAAEQLLVLVYDELRRLEASKLAYEAPGQ